jgi:hypothetical protein
MGAIKSAAPVAGAVSRGPAGGRCRKAGCLDTLRQLTEAVKVLKIEFANECVPLPAAWLIVDS